MTACSIEATPGGARRRRDAGGRWPFGAALLSLGLLLSVEAAAQSGAPKPLVPPQGGAGSGAADSRERPPAAARDGERGDPAGMAEDRAVDDRPRAPQGLEVETLPPAPINESPRRREGIFVDALEPIDPATVGVLTERDPGGFGGDIWAGLERRQVATLLRGLPADLASPVFRDLLRRLLLTSAAPPAGPRAEAGGASLAGLRAERLLALGDTPALVRLLEVAPEGSGDELLDRTRLQARLITGREQQACGLGRQGVSDYGSLWWSKALVFCQLAAGQEEAAMLGLDLLREQGRNDADQDFLQLANAMMGLGRAPDAPVPTPLNLAMLAKLQARPDVGLLETAPLGRSEQLLGLQSLPGAARVALAERAAAAGVLPGDRLADFYDVFDFGEAALADAVGTELDPAELRDRALLFRAAERGAAAPETAELLARYLEGTRAAGVGLAGLRAALPLAVELRPEPGLARWAAAPGRSLFYDGRLEQALAWFENARAAGGQWPEAAVAARLLWPYARLAGTPAAGWTGLDAWAGEAEAAGLDRRTVTLLAAALYGLGERDALGAAGAEPGAATPPAEGAQLDSLRAAAEAGRVGETLLRAAGLLGDRFAGELHPLTLAAVVRALISVDLTPEARRFAMEALVTRGL